MESLFLVGHSRKEINSFFLVFWPLPIMQPNMNGYIHSAKVLQQIIGQVS